MWINADWPAPAHVHALTTTRQGGVSQAPYASLNLGQHVGDEPARVQQNRNLLAEKAHLPESPRWLQQTHGTTIADADNWQPEIEADAIISAKQGQVCAVMTADCLPVLLTDRNGQQVAAIHAGWRGLLAGIIEKTVNHFATPGNDIIAWLGPAIGPEQFEVGREVMTAFTAADIQAAKAFIQTDDQHYLADIYQLARQRLAAVGVQQVYGGQFCTVSDSGRFFSYRRDDVTGRMASLIWISHK